jgi:glycine cleavage system aminomethyltransferase T
MILDDGTDNHLTLECGDGVYSDDDKIGEIANIGYSFTLNRWIALAFLDTDYAYVGLDYRFGGKDVDLGAKTVSAPFIFNQSLRIRPQEDSYFNET